MMMMMKKKKTLVEYIECFHIVHCERWNSSVAGAKVFFIFHTHPTSNEMWWYEIYLLFSCNILRSTPHPFTRFHRSTKHKYGIVCSKYSKIHFYAMFLQCFVGSYKHSSFALKLNILFLFHGLYNVLCTPSLLPGRVRAVFGALSLGIFVDTTINK